ncbi:MAG: Thiol:disulfide interchange protein DsbD [Legionellaceae bacterium]
MLSFKKNIYHLLIFLFFPILCFAFSYEQPLAPEKAFIMTCDFKEPNILYVKWKMAGGYFLYKTRFQFAITNNKNASLKILGLPKGKMHHDALLGDYEIYENEVTIPLQLASMSKQKNNISKYKIIDYVYNIKKKKAHKH